MSEAEKLVRWLDRLHSKAPIFIGSIVLLGLLLVGISGLFWQSAKEQDIVIAAHDNRGDLLQAASDVELGALQMIRGERGYLLTGNRDFLRPYHEGNRTLTGALDRLETLSANGHGDPVAVAQIREKSTVYQEILRRTVAHGDAAQNEEAMRLIKTESERLALNEMTASLSRLRTSQRIGFSELQASVVARRGGQRVFFYFLSFVGLCLVALASVSVVAMRRAAERERAYRKELRMLAETDELTGLANRREFMAALERTISASQRSCDAATLAIIDIDHFKRVNDTYGHGAGDEVIRHIARVAMQEVRGGDVVGRLGGEEFAIILPATTPDQAYDICERLRLAVQGTNIALPGGESVSVTISSGIARLRRKEDAALLIDRADKALYQAKNTGRDRVRLAA